MIPFAVIVGDISASKLVVLAVRAALLVAGAILLGVSSRQTDGAALRSWGDRLLGAGLAGLLAGGGLAVIE